MGIVYRYEKKEPLTIAEMDGNFAYLDLRIKEIEAKPSFGEGIAKVTQEGDQVTFIGTFGSVLGKVTLPKFFPAYRGKWETETTYRVFDWVQKDKGLYSCIQPHNAKEFDGDKACWVLVFEL